MRGRASFRSIEEATAIHLQVAPFAVNGMNFPDIAERSHSRILWQFDATIPGLSLCGEAFLRLENDIVVENS
jgi:hypothetical protein